MTKKGKTYERTFNSKIIWSSQRPRYFIQKVTLFIGDQGTGKSCVAKLFSMFKWTEKVLSQKNTSFHSLNNTTASKLNYVHIIE